jgi:hypothetical protein
LANPEGKREDAGQECSEKRREECAAVEAVSELGLPLRTEFAQHGPGSKKRTEP